MLFSVEFILDFSLAFAPSYETFSVREPRSRGFPGRVIRPAVLRLGPLPRNDDPARFNGLTSAVKEKGNLDKHAEARLGCLPVITQRSKLRTLRESRLKTAKPNPRDPNG